MFQVILTVEDLIEHLNDMPKEAVVSIYGYGRNDKLDKDIRISVYENLNGGVTIKEVDHGNR